MPDEPFLPIGPTTSAPPAWRTSGPRPADARTPETPRYPYLESASPPPDPSRDERDTAACAVTERADQADPSLVASRLGKPSLAQDIWRPYRQVSRAFPQVGRGISR